MSDRYIKLFKALQDAAPGAGIPIIQAQVKAITGDTCTVTYGDLDLTDVRLKATIGSEGNELLLVPKVGSTVLLGSLTNDLKDLAVLRIDELESISYSQDGLQISIDAATGGVSIQNEEVSLTALFQQIVNIWKAFKMFTPSGPTGGLLPDTLAAVNQFEIDFKKLLK